MLSATKLKNDLTFVLLGASKLSNRPVLHGVYFDFHHKTMVGCDGYRLHIATIDSLPINSFILHYSDCKKLSDKLKKTGSPVAITWDNDKVIFSQRYQGKEEVYSFTPVEGTYPDYEAIIPKTQGKEITLSYNTSEMVNNVFGNVGSVTLSGTKAQTRQDLPYPVTMTIPEDILPGITVNPKYLFNAAQGGGILTLYVTHPTAPFLFKSGSYSGVIMPMSTHKK
jgi:DNA polymerase III sliding clamp (beta) subunit (PCNA family)